MQNKKMNVFTDTKKNPVKNRIFFLVKDNYFSMVTSVSLK